MECCGPKISKGFIFRRPLWQISGRDCHIFQIQNPNQGQWPKGCEEDLGGKHHHQEHFLLPRMYERRIEEAID